MESELFHTTAFVDGIYQLCALIDSGCTAFATISQRHVQRLNLPTHQLPPRKISGYLDNVSSVIDQVTTFSMDIAGITSRIWAYVIPGQQEDLILGTPWMMYHHADLFPSEQCLKFKMHGISLYSNEYQDKIGTKPTLSLAAVSGSTYAALAQRAKKDKTIQIFSASLSDIQKALAVKPKLTMEEIVSKLPPHFRHLAAAFDPQEGSKLPPFRPGLDHEIPLEKDELGKDKLPPWGPLYNMSHDELLVLRKELTSLLDKGFIQHSKSPAAAPVLFAKKPGGGLRFCVDYRGINTITSKDRYPLPLIKETLTALNKAKWLTKLDVSAAFHKIRMAKGEEWKTAFRTRYGLFEWRVCPFGLTGSPATFQRYINWVLREYLDDFCSAYVDDIMIFSTGSLADHRQKVEKVISKLIEHGLQLDIGKCEFETHCTKYLGYIIEVGVGIKMDPDKVKAIVEWLPPTSVKGVRSFLGFANYYRIFIKDYASISKPLTDLTKKDNKFLWTEACQLAFEQLKKMFQEEPILATFNPDLDTQLEADSSGWATGGVLTQLDPVLQAWRPVAFFSAKHLPAECNYDIHDKELLAIVKCVKEWHSELRGLNKPFTILTDHKNLEPFTTKKNLNERQVRWSQLLSTLNFQLKHRPGSSSIIPDALSRRDQDIPKDVTDSRLVERQQTLLPGKLWIQLLQPSELACPFLDDNHLRKLWTEALGSETGKLYLQAYSAVQNQERQFPTELNLRISTGECSISARQLHYRERLWLPNYEPLNTAVIQKVHDSFLSGHPGRDATIALLARRFFWPGINQEVRRFVKNCDVCGRTTIWRDKKKGLLKPLPVPSQIWKEISMDFVTGLPESGKDKSTVILVIVDRLSKGVVLLPVPPDMFDAEGVAKLILKHYVPHHWIPRAITSDRGSQFVNAFWKKLCNLLNITQRLSTAYHPETDGSTERVNQEMETYLRTFVAYEQEDWSDWIPLAQIAICNKPATSTQISPFFMTHGYDAEVISITPDLAIAPGTPAERGQEVVQKLQEAQEFAQTSMAVAQQAQEHYANNSRETSVTYQKGDKVWLNLKNISTTRPSKKLDWIHAKYTVTRTFPENPHFYELDTPRGIYNKFHTSLLRPAANTPLPSQVTDDVQPQPIIGNSGDEEFGVEEILKARSKKVGRGSRREVLVKWAGYAQPSWHPLHDFEDTLALDAFEAKYGDAYTSNGPTEEGGG